MFCRFLHGFVFLRCESKTRVFFFGTFFIRSVCFFRSCFQSDCLERPHLVCNQNSCSMLDMFYFLEMCKEEKTQNFQSRIFSSCFCFGPFVFSGFSCDLFDFALVISPLKSLFSWGELADTRWNCLFHWSWLKIMFFLCRLLGEFFLPEMMKSKIPI